MPEYVQFNTLLQQLLGNTKELWLGSTGTPKAIPEHCMLPTALKAIKSLPCVTVIE